MRYLYHLINKLFGNFRYDYNSLWDKKLNEILSDFEIVKRKDTEYVVLKHNERLYEIHIDDRLFLSYGLEKVDFIEVDYEYRFRPSLKTMCKFDKLILESLERKSKEDLLQKIKDIYN